MASLKSACSAIRNAPVAELFDAWERGASKVTCLVPEGVAREKVRLSSAPTRCRRRMPPAAR
jgi:hypothetical protein